MNTLILALSLVSTNRVDISFRVPGPGIYTVQCSQDHVYWRGVAAEIVDRSEQVHVIDRANQACTFYRVQWWSR